METHKRESLLQLLDALDNIGEYRAYKSLYEAVSSALSELTDSYLEKRQDQTNALLMIWSRLLKHICARLDGDDCSIVYEAGRLCGIVSVIEYLFRKEQEFLSIDAAMAELLSKSKPASRRILYILFESSQEEEWVSKHTLEKKSSQSQTALSNIMKRLIRAQAVDFYKDGREVKYRLTSAGKRYYEKSISPSMNSPINRQLNDISDKIDCMQNSISELSEQINQQAHTIGDLRRDIFSSLGFNKITLANTVDPSNPANIFTPEVLWSVKFNEFQTTNTEYSYTA